MANTRGSFFGTVSVRIRFLRERTNWWRLPNSLALDAALIAVCWQSLAAKSLGVELAVTHGLLLAAVPWLGYMAERWWDGLSMGKRACTDRHLLAARYRAILLLAWVLVLFASLCLALETLPVDELSAGFVLAGLCAANAILAALLARFLTSSTLALAFFRRFSFLCAFLLARIKKSRVASLRLVRPS